jgi:hypothetical protein
MPLNVRELCEFRKMRVYEQYLADCDARLTPLREGYIVEVDKAHGASRQNFSLCHEIGHTFFLDSPSERVGAEFSCSPIVNQENNKIEYLCNVAATELLMPEGDFQRVTSDFRPSLASARMVAAAFGTSLETTLLRILELDLWQCCLLCARHERQITSGGELDWEGWTPSVTLGYGFLAVMGVIFELESILSGEGYGVNFLRRLAIAGEKARIVMPGLTMPVFLESYSCSLRSADRYYVLVVFEHRGRASKENYEFRLLDHENVLELS